MTLLRRLEKDIEVQKRKIGTDKMGTDKHRRYVQINTEDLYL